MNRKAARTAARRMDVMLAAVRPWSDPKAKGLLPLSTPLPIPSPPLTQNGIHPFLSLLFMCCSPWQAERPTALLSSPHLGPAQKYILVLLLDTPTFWMNSSRMTLQPIAAAAFRLIQNANASFQMRRIVQTADGSMAESLETE